MIPRSRRNGPRRAQQGVSLLEVLIAVLVMAIGILGIAALQATALRNNQGAMERTQAVIQTYSILDAIRANRAQAKAYLMDRQCGPANTGGGRVGTELGLWLAQVRQFNPDACATIREPASNPQGRVEVIIDWPNRDKPDESFQVKTVGGY